MGKVSYFSLFPGNYLLQKILISYIIYFNYLIERYSICISSKHLHLKTT